MACLFFDVIVRAPWLFVFRFCEKSLNLGDLKGNHFSIVLRWCFELCVFVCVFVCLSACVMYVSDAFPPLTRHSKALAVGSCM